MTSTPLHPATGEALTAEAFAELYEPALREGNLGLRWLLDAQAEKDPAMRALRDRIVDAFTLAQPPREIVDAREVLTGRIEVCGTRVRRTMRPRRLRTPLLPEAGEPRRRAIARLLRHRFGCRPELDLDAPARAAREAAR